MTIQQARAIITNDVIFETYVEWRRNGGSFNAAAIRQRPNDSASRQRTIIKRLEKANALLNSWAVSQQDTHTDDFDTIEGSHHLAECRALSLITLAQGHECRSIVDKSLQKILRRIA